LLLLARPIVNLISPNQENKNKVKIFQALNLLVIVLQIVDIALRPLWDIIAKTLWP